MADSSHLDTNIITTTDSNGNTSVSVVNTNIVESSSVESVIVSGGRGAQGDKGDTGTTDYLELQNLPDLTLKADKSDTYTKTEVDNKDTTIATTAQTNLTAHTLNTNNPHSVTKTQVGLGNVDNLAPADMPVSTATQTALNAKANATDTVNLTGNQTVAGVKTFSSSPVVPTATTDTQAVNKAQMDAADALKLNISDNRVELRGTGMPNGVVTASPGTYYTDTAGTSGAWRWLKKSGTGNTGWECIVGDTGWRDITPADHLLGTGGYVLIRRIGEMIDLQVRLDTDKSFTGSNTGVVITPGLRKTKGMLVSSPARNTSNTLWDIGATLYFATAGTNGTLYFAGTLTRNSIFPFSYPTGDAWPTTLPGVSA